MLSMAALRGIVRHESAHTYMQQMESCRCQCVIASFAADKTCRLSHSSLMRLPFEIIETLENPISFECATRSPRMVGYKNGSPPAKLIFSAPCSRSELIIFF